MTVDAHWQVQEAKQKFSELLRKVHSDGPQFVTKHGEEVAVVIDIEEFRRFHGSKEDLDDPLLHGIKDDEAADLLDQIIAERKLSLPRRIDFDDET
ncbi:MAG TPA: type II toxin-antitoxin system Phd/YefM family antitoxin [Jatrophihabitantaceae bacterium]|nr:type II toxin-antitoxin system Phd/YefM family antitoxin [Jatrophihabitantaceae bacterium]